MRLIPRRRATATLQPPRSGASNVLTFVHHLLATNPRQRVTLVGVDDHDWSTATYEDAHYFPIDCPEKPLWNRWTDRVAMRFHRDERDDWKHLCATHPNVEDSTYRAPTLGHSQFRE